MRNGVTAFRWSPANASILAVAYSAKTGSNRMDGVLLIWCAKNPSQPGREYTFDSPLSDIDWSKERPNLLAIGFYDGSVKVIDVSAKKVNIIRQSHRETSAACSPHWQVRTLLIYRGAHHYYSNFENVSYIFYLLMTKSMMQHWPIIFNFSTRFNGGAVTNNSTTKNKSTPVIKMAGYIATVWVKIFLPQRSCVYIELKVN